MQPGTVDRRCSMGRVRARRQRGFTLLEIMVVITILGIAAGYSMVAYKGVTDEQKLRSTARELIGLYAELRARAARDRRICWLSYDIERGAYKVIVYPYTDLMGNWVDAEGEVLPVEIGERIENLPWIRLDKDVRITQVQAPGEGGTQVFDIDFTLIFRADGTVPPHIIHLKSRSGIEVSIEVEEITGRAILRDGHVPFFSPQEEDFENLAAGDGR